MSRKVQEKWIICHHIIYISMNFKCYTWLSTTSWPSTLLFLTEMLFVVYAVYHRFVRCIKSCSIYRRYWPSEILGISLIAILINSRIILSVSTHKYLTNSQVYEPRHNPFSAILYLSLFIWSISLSIYQSTLLSPHSSPFCIKDVSHIWEASFNKHISKNVVLISKGCLTIYFLGKLLCSNASICLLSLHVRIYYQLFVLIIVSPERLKLLKWLEWTLKLPQTLIQEFFLHKKQLKTIKN